MSNNRHGPQPHILREFLSLREISRRLGIPPSTVVYYKDRFFRFIPHEGGEGNRKRYSPEVVGIFKEIRQMFNNNWSAAQIEEDLARRACVPSEQDAFEGEPETQRSCDASVPDACLAAELAVVLERLSDLLQCQTAFRAEIDSLRSGILQLKKEKEESEARSRRKMDLLQKEMERLHRDRAELMRLILEGARTGGARKTPSGAFLGLPLVVKTQQGEYLGVAGKTKPFSLKEFLLLIEQNAKGQKHLGMHWSRRGHDGWTLSIMAEDIGTGLKNEHRMEIAQTITPSSNNVIHLQRMTSNGKPVPEEVLLELFRRIKDGFNF